MSKSNDWMPLGQAYDLVVEAEQSEQLAEYRLVQVLKTGELHHRAGHAILGRFKSDRREVLNEPVPNGFFGSNGFWGWPSKIDWRKSEAVRDGSQFYQAFRIEVSREGLERLWPAIAADNAAPDGANKMWVTEAVDRHIKNKTLPRGKRDKAKFAETLEGEMGRDHTIKKPMKARSIGNMLTAHGLWPHK